MLNWSFIQNTLHEIRFSSNFISLIMYVVSNVNGMELDEISFRQKRGIRQDGLYSFCFNKILQLICEVIQDGVWKPPIWQAKSSDICG